MKPFKYVENTAPDDYVCSVCSQGNYKLWRPPHMEDLYCYECCGDKEGQNVSEIDSFGRSLNIYTQTVNHFIGNMLPAIPTEDGDNFWGYASTPSSGYDWWLALPTVSH